MMKNIFLMIVTIFYMNTTFAGFEEIFGNAENGDQCQSDFQCQSLCCDQSSGVCNPHDPTATKPVFCSKPAGEQCLTSQFCKTEWVPTCKLVNLGTGSDGKVMCALRCPAVETRGSCINGYCQSPKIPPMPPFDPANPDCSNAVDQ